MSADGGSIRRDARLTILQHLLDALLELFLVGNTRAMDIVDTYGQIYLAHVKGGTG